MAIRVILKDSDEMLRKISKPVTDFDERLGLLLDDMRETMIKAEGAGLAAVQVGVLKRLFVMHAGKCFRECINPKILKQEGENKIKVEGCLSVPGKCGYVDRPERIWVEYQDRTGKVVSKKFSGFEAKCFCHEFDHLDGILYTDKATKMFNNRDELKKEMESGNFKVAKPAKKRGKTETKKPENRGENKGAEDKDKKAEGKR